MTETPKAQAWNDYWRGQQRGCLPESSSTLDAALRAEWHRVALALADKARVIDLATGNGVVLRWLREVRPDLDLTGVDLADPLPPPPPGSVTNGRRGDGAFAFPRRQLRRRRQPVRVRIWRARRGRSRGRARAPPGGTANLITHHADGPIVAHNRARAAGLAWVLDDAAMGAHAHALSAESRHAIEQGPRLAAARFGAGSAGWQLAEAIARVVRDGGTPLDARAIAMLDQLERMARGEISRIAALEQASAAIAAEGELEACLAQPWSDPHRHAPVVHAPDGLTIANCWTFERR